MTENFLTGQILPAYRGQILPASLLWYAGLQGVNFTRVCGIPRGQILPAINNYQGIGGILQRKPATNSDPPGALRGGRGTVS